MGIIGQGVSFAEGGYEYTGRNNHPTANQRVGLEASFYNQGARVSPYSISGVTLFSKNDFPDTKSVLGSDGLISSSITSDKIKYHWHTPSGEGGLNSPEGAIGSVFYSDEAADASTVYWLQHGSQEYGVNTGDEGNFVVLLEGQKDGDSIASTYDFHGSEISISNTAKTVGEYFDVWTVQLTEDQAYTSFIFPSFTLYYDTWYGLPEPLQLTTTHRLLTKKITDNSMVTIKISSEFTVHNKNIDDSLKNILKDVTFTNLGFQLQKIIDNPIEGTEPILSIFPEGAPSESNNWATTTNSYPDQVKLGSINVGSDNTINIPMDFRKTGGASITSGSKQKMGYQMKGTWRVKVKYDLVGERLISPWMYFTVF